MRFLDPASWHRALFLFAALCVLGAALASRGGGMNVMGRSVPDGEYQASYDRDIARERQHLEPTGAHDEKGRIPSWDQYWCTAGGLSANPPTAQSRRLKKYVVEQRRAAGLQELSITGDFGLGSYRPNHYYASGDPRIFRW